MPAAERRAYYAIIPANVRYDRSLSANEKLLYGEISALCNEKGYCWSTNKYFSDLFGVSQVSISRWISALVRKKYLFVKIVYREGTREILARHLSIVKQPADTEKDTSGESGGNPIDAKEDFPDDENEDTPVIKSDNTPIIKNVNTPIIKNDKENSKEINTKGVNKSVSQSIEKEKKQKTDELTDEIREKLKRQIEYDFFEENFPEDLPGVDVLVDCMAEMLLSPYTKINGIAQRRSVLKPYIDKVDADTIREFLDHMRGKKMRDVKNISAYWQSALINFIKEEELVMLTI